MNSARIFASRNNIIDWINRTLRIQMTKIQQLGSGVIYCLLLDCGYPQRIPISKIKWYVNTQVDFIHNFKILQASFCHLGIQKKIEIGKLIKTKYQDNLDFIQWLKWFLEPKIQQKYYDSLRRRQNREVYLDFCSHKIIKLPAKIHFQNKQRGLVKDKNGQKINKKLKKIYRTNDDLTILECRTQQSDNQVDLNDCCNNMQKQKIKLLKTSRNFNTNNLEIHHLDQQYMLQSDRQYTKEKKSHKFSEMDNRMPSIQSRQSVQCIYTSPKQINKFYFPERFSQRLKKRVDIVNRLKKTQDIKEDINQEKGQTQKMSQQRSKIYIDDNIDCEGQY